MVEQVHYSRSKVEDAMVDLVICFPYIRATLTCGIHSAMTYTGAVLRKAVTYGIVETKDQLTALQ
jgi:hypothetical protein